MYRTTFALTVVAALMCQVASASIHVVDDSNFGVGALTRDTAQGLEFLDLTFSTNRSADDVRTHFGVGGDFEGFRYATQVEVMNLINNFGFSPIFTETADGTYAGDTGTDQLSGLVSILGLTLDHSVFRQAWGITGTYLGNGHDRVVVLQDRIDHSSNGDDQIVNLAQRRDLFNSMTGSFLVREAVVPEPMSIIVWTLMGLGAIGILIRRKDNI